MINTTLISDLPLSNVANIAHWQANQALRAGRKAQELHRLADAIGLPDAESKTRAQALSFEHEFSVHTNKMYDVLEASRYPTLTTEALVRTLGRSKAMVLKINRPLINLALRNQ
jgi:hypothetical protein